MSLLKFDPFSEIWAILSNLALKSLI
jgi:hypothetical protein